MSLSCLLESACFILRPDRALAEGSQLLLVVVVSRASCRKIFLELLLKLVEGDTVLFAESYLLVLDGLVGLVDGVFDLDKRANDCIG